MDQIRLYYNNLRLLAIPFACKYANGCPGRSWTERELGYPLAFIDAEFGEFQSDISYGKL
jgi:hypothetical protein